MAMFERDGRASTEAGGTIVGANVRLTGILKDSNDITVHGEVEGEVISDQNVTITESSTIKGPITAENVVIAGSVHGAVTARDKIEVLPSGRVYGSMTMKDLTIRSGAIFIGKSTMPDQRKNGVTPVAKPAVESKSSTPATKKPVVATNERSKVLTYEVEE